MKLNNKFVAGLFLSLVVSAPSLASEIYKADETHAVQFQKGKSAATINGKVTGNKNVDHTLAAKEGQMMEVKIDSTRQHPYFNVISPSGEAIFVGTMSDKDIFVGRLPSTGKYTVRVYQRGNAKDANETHTFKLSVKITN